ncbi:MAG: methyltransferase domain-containing protein [Cyanobacteria bacterium]|jgi:predicted SAM-dependent methyltransferase|nr:methyltransferase domain-containing protein [Cyanobacteria bacterium GSL.Bin21]
MPTLHLNRSKVLRSLVRGIRKQLLLLDRPRKIKSYLEQYKIRKLQLGAGPNCLEGWLNTDLWPIHDGVLFFDATKPFPLEDNTFDYIISENQIEHLSYYDALFMLRECYRILKPNGKIRIATPNLEVLAGLYKNGSDQNKQSKSQQKYIKAVIDNWWKEVNVYSPCFVFNISFYRFGHKFIYDTKILQYSLEKSGFLNVTRQILGESNEPVFQNIELHIKDEYVKFDALVLEASKGELKNNNTDV